MAYIGKIPSTGAFSMLDNLTASATASYSLTLDSTAFVPESANHLIVSLNGTIQKAGSSFNVSGSTLTFSSALTSSDSIDFILALGNVLDIGTPSDATVTNAKTNFVSTSSSAGLQIRGDGTTDGTLALNCRANSHAIKLKSPPHSASQSYTLTFPSTAPSANKALITDGSGNLSFGNAGGLSLVHASSSSSPATSFSIDNVFTSTYDNYLMMLEVEVSDTSGYYMRLLKSDGSERASDYYLADLRLILASDTVSGTDSSQNVSTFYLGRHSGSDVGAPSRHLIHFYDPYTSSKYTTIFGQCFSYHDTLNEYIARWQTGHQDNVETHRGFKIVSNSGNVDEYDVKIWGYTNS